MLKKIISNSFKGILVAAATLSVLSIIDNIRQGKNKVIKTNNYVQLFRFKKLYEVLINWDKTSLNCDSQGYIDSFISDWNNHERITPILSEKYRKKLKDQYEKTSDLLMKMIFLRVNSDFDNSESLKKDYKTAYDQFVDEFVEYNDLLLKTINKQMCELMDG